MTTIEVRASTTVPAGATLTDRPITTEEVAGVDEATARFFAQVGFEGNAGQVVVERGPVEGPVDVIVGLGPSAQVDAAVLRNAAAAVVRQSSRHESMATTLVEHRHGVSLADATDAVVRGLVLASYRYDQFKDAPDSERLRRATVVGAGVDDHLASAVATADAVAFTRDLVNEPGGSLVPARFADVVSARARSAGLEVEIWDNARLEAERMGGILAVNQGSEHEARLVILRYRPDGASAEVALVGKGVTFDSGGLSLKSATNMANMKVDMGGAAAVAGAMCALADAGCEVAVTAYLALTDNMTGPDAQRPGDVFTARNGTTVEVLNTDAEGRLILADALALAAESTPDAVIDAATLTGSASAALGLDYTALFVNDDRLAERLSNAADAEGEFVWRMPLHEKYRAQLDSNVADLKNIGSGAYGGAILAALFLAEFVGDVPWAHLDLGLSVASDVDSGLRRVGATGALTATLISALGDWTR